MNRRLNYLIAAFALAAGPALGSDSDQPIQVNTRGLPSHIAAQVEKHAAESERALMQYLWFTRRMNRLWLDDVTKPMPDDVAANEPPQDKRVAVLMHPHGFKGDK
jgi:hypothetical protein